MASFSPIKKRFLIALPLGLVAGILLTGLTSVSTPDVWGTALMWTIITNCYILGLVIALAGAYTRHPVLGFPIPAYFRGCILGVAASLPLAAGAMMTPLTPWSVFWGTIFLGAIYGSIVDIVATRFGGEGKDLLKV